VKQAKACYILADDLTGAAEVGAELAARGQCVVVMLESRKSGPGMRRSGLQIINLRCRTMESRVARQLVKAVCLELLQDDETARICLKIDSAARGPIKGLMEGACEAMGMEAIPVMLANPRQGRVTQHGVHYVGGVPLAQSAFRHDPLHPANESKLQHLIAPGLLMDAQTPNEIRRQAECHQRARVIAGAAPFIVCMIHEWQARGCHGVRQALRFLPANAMVICGSRHAAARQLLQSIDCARSACEGRGPVVIATPANPQEPMQAMTNLMRAVQSTVERFTPEVMMLIGGETAQTALERLHISEIEMLGKSGAFALGQANWRGALIRLLMIPGSYWRPSGTHQCIVEGEIRFRGGPGIMERSTS
jgi:uncharacterized protein YgbK (DUF1537 family)